MTYPKGTIIRYSTASRINHWITGGCFVLLVLSGLSMFHPLLFFLSDLFGGGQWTRAVHPWIGVVLLLSYSGLIVQFWRDEMWTRDDLAWTKAITRVVVNEEEGVPEVARFNAGQKFVFWAMALLVPSAVSSYGKSTFHPIRRSNSSGSPCWFIVWRPSQRSSCGSSMFTPVSGSGAPCGR